MAGFSGALGNIAAGIGKGILDRSIVGQARNRYLQHRAAGAPPEPPMPADGSGTGPMFNYPQPDPPPDAGEPPQYENAAQGKIIMTPTVVRLAEHGQPEAVVPLNNAPGNHVRPDMLQGHLAPPKVPGMRYQKFKGYVNPAY